VFILNSLEANAERKLDSFAREPNELQALILSDENKLRRATLRCVLVYGMPTFETIGSILKRKGYEICSLPPEAPVRDALVVMAQKGISAVLVVSDGKPIGIVSAKDYGRRVVLEGKDSKTVRVREVMSSPVITIEPDADAAHGLEIMTRHNIRHLPVIDKGRLAGVVSMGDLASAIISDQAYAIDHLKEYIGRA
jgi:CBS domain-containing protein